MAYGNRYIPLAGPAVPPVAPAAPGAADDAAYIVELKRFSTLLETMTLQGAIAKIQEELDSDEWWWVGIIEGYQDEWSDWFDNILGADVEWDKMDEANKWIWQMWFTNEIARRELLAKGYTSPKLSDFTEGMLAELKAFRALLDKMTLAKSITAFEKAKKVSGWWSTHIRDLAQNEWLELFERMGVDTEDPSFNPEAEKHKWVWKRFFDEAIKDMEAPGKPRDTVDPDNLDRLSGKVEAVDQKVEAVKSDLDARVPAPGPAPAAEPIAETWPEPIPESPTLVLGPDVKSLDAVWDKLMRHGVYLPLRKEYMTDVLFNIGWMLEMTRVCLNELKAAKAPGTQTDNFKNNLEGLGEGSIELESKGVFHD